MELIYLVYFFPLTSIFFLISFFILILKLLNFSYFEKNHNKINIIFSILAVILMLTNSLYLSHSIYYHTNFLTMTYFTLGTLGICFYIKTNNISILILGILALSTTCLIRKEMLMFCLIPLVYLNYKDLLPSLSAKIKIFATFLFGYSFGIWHTLWSSQYSLNLKLFIGHGSNFLYIASIFILVLLIFTKPFKLLGDNNILKKFLIIFVLLLSSILMYILKPESTMQTITRLFELMFTNKGRWFASWYIILIPLLIISIDLVLFKKYKFLEITNNEHSYLILHFLFSVVCIFLISRVFLYVLFNSPADNTFNASGNRILLHIYPVGIILVFYLMKILSISDYKKN